MIKTIRTSFLTSLLFFGIFASAAEEVQTPSSTFPAPQRAEESEMAPHFGILLGTASPEGSSYTPAGSVAIDVGLQPIIPFGLGAEISHYQSKSEDHRDNMNRTQLLLKSTYNFGGQNIFVKNTYVGLGVGTIYDTDEFKIVSAPIIGFDIPMRKASSPRDNSLSLGASAQYAVIEGSSPDTLTVNGALKYWY